MNFRKSKTIDYTITCEIHWECPYCEELNCTVFRVSPYRVLAEDSPDESCKECGEYCSLNFYENKE